MFSSKCNPKDVKCVLLCGELLCRKVSKLMPSSSAMYVAGHAKSSVQMRPRSVPSSGGRRQVRRVWCGGRRCPVAMFLGVFPLDVDRSEESVLEPVPQNHIHSDVCSPRVPISSHVF